MTTLNTHLWGQIVTGSVCLRYVTQVSLLSTLPMLLLF